MNNDSDAGIKPGGQEIEQEFIVLYNTIEASWRALVRCWQGIERKEMRQ